jgi:hypothetical protein
VIFVDQPMLSEQRYDGTAAKDDHALARLTLHRRDRARVKIVDEMRIVPGDLLQGPGENQLVRLVQHGGKLPELRRSASRHMRVRRGGSVLQNVRPEPLEHLVRLSAEQDRVDFRDAGRAFLVHLLVRDYPVEVSVRPREVSVRRDPVEHHDLPHPCHMSRSSM